MLCVSTGHESKNAPICVISLYNAWLQLGLTFDGRTQLGGVLGVGGVGMTFQTLPRTAFFPNFLEEGIRGVRCESWLDKDQGGELCVDA